MPNNDLTKKSLVNTYYNSTTKKLYQVNSDGTRGSEIKMGMPLLDFANKQTLGAGQSITTTKDGCVTGVLGTSDTRRFTIGGFEYVTPANVGGVYQINGIPAGTVITAGAYSSVTFVPYL